MNIEQALRVAPMGQTSLADLYLCDSSIEALGIDLPMAGDVFQIVAEGQVASVSLDSTGSKSITLRLNKLDMQPDAASRISEAAGRRSRTQNWNIAPDDNFEQLSNGGSY